MGSLAIKMICIVVIYTLIILSVIFGIMAILNFIISIINFKKPDMYCANCGKKLIKAKGKCPKCKTELS